MRIMGSVLLMGLVGILMVGCGGLPGQAEMQALGFVESITGVKYYSVDLESKKTVSGPREALNLKEGEHRWRVEGTVRDADGKRYTIQAFVDEVDGGERWRAGMIHLGEGIDRPAGQLEQIHP